MAAQTTPRIQYYFKEDTNQILVSGSDTVAKTNALITSSKNPITQGSTFYNSKIVNYGTDTSYMVKNGPEFTSLINGQSLNIFNSVVVDNLAATSPIQVTGNQNGTGASVTLESQYVGVSDENRILQIVVVQTGSNWVNGETITIPTSQLITNGFTNPSGDLVITLTSQNLNEYGTEIPLKSDQELWVHRGYSTVDGDFGRSEERTNPYRYNPHLHRAYKAYIVVETGSGLPANPWAPLGNDINTNASSTTGGDIPGKFLEKQLAILGNTSSTLSTNAVSGSFTIFHSSRDPHPFVFTKYHTLSSPPIAGAAFRLYYEEGYVENNDYSFSTLPPLFPPPLNQITFNTSDVNTNDKIYINSMFNGTAGLGSYLANLSSSYDNGKSGGKIKIIKDGLSTSYVEYNIDGIEYNGINYYTLDVSNPNISPPSFTNFLDNDSLDIIISEYPQFIGQLNQSQYQIPNSSPQPFNSINLKKTGIYTYTSSAFPETGFNGTPASGSTQFGLYTDLDFYHQYNARLDSLAGGTVRVFFTSSANTSSYFDLDAGYNVRIPALVGTISASGYTPQLGDPTELEPDGTYNGTYFDITIQGPIAGTPTPPPDIFSKRWESAYISYSSSLSSSLDGLYVFNQLPQNDIQVTASMFLAAWTGSAEGDRYGEVGSEYGTAVYNEGEAGDGPTWPTASIRIYTGSYPTAVPSTLDAFVTQSEFRDENIHINGLAITMSYLIPSQSISIKDCLSLALAVSSGSAPSESVENSLVVREYYLEFNTPTSSLEGDGLVPTFVENAFENTLGFSNTADCQPILNNAVGERRNKTIQEVDYTTGIYNPINFQAILSGSAQKSTVPLSNYTSFANIFPRYNGSRTQANSVNSIEGLSGGFGTLPVIDYQRAYFAYCDQILDPYPVVNNKIQLNLKYLINSKGDALNPLLSPYTGLDIEGNWEENGLGNIQVNQISGSAQYDQINGLQPIQVVAKQAVPILYSQTSSAGFTDAIPLEGNPNFVSSFSQSYMQYGQRVGGTIYDAFYNNDQDISYNNLLAGITASNGTLNATQVTSSFLNRWGQFINEDGVSYNDQIGNAVIINETDTTSWTGSTFPIDSDEDTDPNYPNNTATTNPYFGTPGEIFFTMDPIGSGSDGTYSGALSDIYKIKLEYSQPSTVPDQFRTRVGQASSWSNPSGTSSQYGSRRVGQIELRLQKSIQQGQGNWTDIPFTFTTPPKITVYYGGANGNIASLDGTTSTIDFASVSSDESFIGNRWRSGIYENQIQNAIAQGGRLNQVVYISFDFNAESSNELVSGVRYRWNSRLKYDGQTQSVINNDGLKNYWNPNRVPVQGPGVTGGSNNAPIEIQPAIKGPFFNVEVTSAQTEDNTEDNALNYPFWAFSSSNATPPIECNYTSSTSQFDPVFNNLLGSGSIRFDNSTFGDSSTIYLAQTSSAGQDIKPYIDHLNTLSNKGFVEIKNNGGTIQYTGSITGTITAAGSSAQNSRHYTIPVTPNLDNDLMFLDNSELLLQFTTGSASQTRQKDAIMLVSENGNLTYDKDYYIGYLPYIPGRNNAFPGGEEPTDTAWPRPNLPWNVLPNDEIRFINSEQQTYKVITVTPPQKTQEIEGVFRLKLTLDRRVSPGVNINFFLLRRFITSYNSILINQLFPYGSLPQLTRFAESRNTEIISTGVTDPDFDWTETFPQSQSMTENVSGSFISYIPPLRKQDNTPSGFFFPHYPVADIELNPDEVLKQLRDNKLID